MLFLDGEAWAYGPVRAGHAGGNSGHFDGAIVAPMPGRMIALMVASGDRVTRGQPLVVIEAMKMEQTAERAVRRRRLGDESACRRAGREGSVLMQLEGEP